MNHDNNHQVLWEIRQLRREATSNFDSLNNQIDDLRDRLMSHETHYHPPSSGGGTGSGNGGGNGNGSSVGKKLGAIGALAAAASAIIAGVFEGLRRAN